MFDKFLNKYLVDFAEMNESEDNKHLLLVDDEPRNLDSLKIGLMPFGYDCDTATLNIEVLDYLESNSGRNTDAILIDFSRPGWAGFELVLEVKKKYAEIPIIAITGLKAPLSVLAVHQMGIPVITKPFDPQTLHNTIKKHISGN